MTEGNVTMMKKLAYVFLSGEAGGSIEYYKNLIEEKDIYCGDGGANLVDEIGLYPKEIWGDMDSVREEVLKKFQEMGTQVKKFSPDKDFTDGELILEYVSSKGYDEIHVIGGFGGRIDHSLTNTNLLFKYRRVKFITEREEVFAIDSFAELDYPSGTTVSFIPFTDEVVGVTLIGFKFPLDNYTLKRGESICMSNVILQRGRVEFKAGKLLCVVQKKYRKNMEI
ncbi:thiamine pyrophosphokinase [Propionigenium maris DSM 9537]|uniref:Thiamine diphosphokinase n=2 Tax=Propionigenium TaxID=2332 RepID=A0A9W6LN14_9FUSO|nr:thiamine pyrophosphokinase [Propionigenium maris DSM 9537]